MMIDLDMTEYKRRTAEQQDKIARLYALAEKLNVKIGQDKKYAEFCENARRGK